MTTLFTLIWLALLLAFVAEIVHAALKGCRR